MESGGSLEAAAANFSEGATVNVKGKDSLISAGVIYIGQSGMTTSTVSLSGGGKMSAPNILVFANGVINGVGDAVGNIYYYDAGGKLLPGNSPGTLNIIGNLFLDAGTLELEFDSSERDALNVAGQLRVGSQATIKIFHTGSFASILNFGDFFSGSQPTFQTSFADHAFQVLSSDPAVVGQTVTLSFGAQHRNIEVEFGTPTVTNVPEPGTSVLLLVGLLLIGRAVYAKQRNHDPLSADDKRRSPSVAPAAAAGK